MRGARSRNFGSMCSVKTCAGSMMWSSTEIGWTSSRSIARPLLEDHRLRLQERQQTFLAAFAPDPRLLETAERHAEVGAEVVVTNSSAPQLAGDRLGSIRVGGEYRGVEAVDRVVGDAHCVLLVV